MSVKFLLNRYAKLISNNLMLTNFRFLFITVDGHEN